MSHTSTLSTKHEFACATVDATPACDSRCTQDANTLRITPAGDILSSRHDTSGDLVAQDNRGKITKAIMQHMQIGTADPAPRHFECDLIGAHNWLIYFTNFNVAWTFCKLYKSLHRKRPWRATRLQTADSAGSAGSGSPHPLLHLQ